MTMTASNSSHSRKALMAYGAAALLAVTAATAQVATGPAGIDNTGDYRHEVQSCLSGNTQEDRATCLREARNAHAEKIRGRLDNGQQSRFEANSVARCDVQTGDDKAACKARVMGFGDSSGSVAGGGVLRQVETVVPPSQADTATVEPRSPELLVPMPAKP